MPPQELTQTTEATQTPQAPSIGDANLSFSDYERLRRGETLPAVDKATADPSAPSAKSGGSEQKKSVDSDTTENEAKEETDAEADADESESQDEGKEAKAEDEEKGEKSRKKSGFQRKVDKLLSRERAAKQEADYWRQQALNGAKSGSGDAASKVDAPKAQAESKEPSPDNFETHAEYVKAVAKWAADDARNAMRQEIEAERLKSQTQSQIKAHYDREKAFASKTADYAEALEEVDHFRGATPVMVEVLTASENGPEVMYELAKNPEEYERIRSLSPIAAARELGRFEAKVAASKASAEKKPETKKLTQAPKPIEPVGGSKSLGANKSPEEMTFAEYEKHRREQMRRKRG